MKTVDTAHMGIFASVARPFSKFLGGAWDEAGIEILLPQYYGQAIS